MSKQPEAERLAGYLDDCNRLDLTIPEAAAELRRLHEVNTELLEALRELYAIINLAIADGDWIVDGACDPDACMRRAEDLIAKATGEQA